MLGVALEGGGARCAAQVGVLLALEEAQLGPDVIAGCGAGGWVAALYASGLRAQRLQQAVSHIQENGKRLFSPSKRQAFHMLCRANLPSAGLYDATRLHRFLRLQTMDALLADVEIPLAIPAWDIESGAVQVLGSILPTMHSGYAWNRHAALSDVVLASLAMPGVFSPMSWRGRRLMGGNAMSPHLSHLLRAMGAKRILRVCVMPNSLSPYEHGMLTLMMTSMSSMQGEDPETHCLHVPLPAQAGVETYGLLSQNVQHGYVAARQALSFLVPVLRVRGRVLPFNVR